VSVIMWRDPEHPLVYNHDQGSTLFFELTDAEGAQLRSRIAELGALADALVGPLPAVEAT
jgi:hypothetical protein